MNKMNKLLAIANRLQNKLGGVEIMDGIPIEVPDEDPLHKDPLPGKPLWKDEPRGKYHRVSEDKIPINIKEEISSLSEERALRLQKYMLISAMRNPHLANDESWAYLARLIRSRLRSLHAHQWY